MVGLKLCPTSCPFQPSTLFLKAKQRVQHCKCVTTEQNRTTNKQAKANKKEPAAKNAFTADTLLLEFLPAIAMCVCSILASLQTPKPCRGDQTMCAAGSGCQPMQCTGTEERKRGSAQYTKQTAVVHEPARNKK